MNKLAAMRTFVEIVDAGSLTGAAEVLGKALPTVVRSLATLERELGVRLLQRTTRRMSLTTEGRLYLERCRQILADVVEAEQVLTQRGVQPQGLLRVTAPVLFGRLRVVPAVASYLDAHPQVSVDLILLDRVVSLIEEGIDVGVRIAPLPDSSMIATRVGWERRVVVASPELLRRTGVPQHPRELSELPIVDFHRRATAPAWSFVEQDRPLAVSVRGRLSCNQAAAAIDACRLGLGLGRFLSYQVRSAVEAGELEIVLESFEPPPIPVHLLFAHARLVSPRIRSFVDWMKEHL